MLSFKNFKELLILEKILKEKNILILGYYFDNFLFYKKDLILSKIDIKGIIPFFVKRKKKIKEIYKKILFIIKINIKKIIILLTLKKKYGNN